LDECFADAIGGLMTVVGSEATINVFFFIFYSLII